jgi:transposase
MNEIEKQDHANFFIDAPSIVICTEAIDLRYGIDGLSELVMRSYKANPKKTIFVFLNGKKDRIKVLAWHHNGFILLCKKLEKGKFFNMNTKKHDSIKITKEQLNWVIMGLDWVTMGAFGELEYKYETKMLIK